MALDLFQNEFLFFVVISVKTLESNSVADCGRSALLPEGCGFDFMVFSSFLMFSLCLHVFLCSCVSKTLPQSKKCAWGKVETLNLSKVTVIGDGCLYGPVTNWWLVQGVWPKTTGTGSWSTDRKLWVWWVDDNRKICKTFNKRGKWIKAILEVWVVLQQPSLADGMRVCLAVCFLPVHFQHTTMLGSFSKRSSSSW